MFYQNDQDREPSPPAGAVNTSGALMVGVMVALALTAVGAFIAGYLLGRPQIAEDKLKLLTEAWRLIERDFYYPLPTEQDRLYGAINGMLETLGDRHTMLLKPSLAEHDAAVMRGALGGIGATVSLTQDGQVQIAEARAGWPAEAAGLQSGDVIVAVDGVEVKGKGLDEVVNLIRGELGTQVRLTISRASVSSPFEVSVTRAQINIFGRILKDTDIAYISMSVFNQTAPADIQAQLERLLPLNPRALILDLRGNGGGLLTESIQIADLFLTEGSVASEKTASGQNHQFNAKTGEIGESIPLVVLVNGSSASASEIVAGAFQDRKRAVLIGQRTFGKGSVQVLHILSDGSQLRITNGAWYTPNETPLEHLGDEPGGLIPDVSVTLPDPPPMGRDLILEAAIDYIYTHIGPF